MDQDDVLKIVSEASKKNERANLTGADLRWANLSWAIGDFAIGYFGTHHAIAAGGYISIGCERHTYTEWLERGAEIGKDNEYTDAEIARYMAWIKIAVDWLSEVETVTTSEI